MNKYTLMVVLATQAPIFEIEAEHLEIYNSCYVFRDSENRIIHSFPINRTIIKKIEYVQPKTQSKA